VTGLRAPAPQKSKARSVEDDFNILSANQRLMWQVFQPSKNKKSSSPSTMSDFAPLWSLNPYYIAVDNPSLH
jgi:hypothetical protein